jgi:hypothetical protein
MCLPLVAGSAAAPSRSRIGPKKGLERKAENVYITLALTPVRDFHNIAYFGLAWPEWLWAKPTPVGFDI